MKKESDNILYATRNELPQSNGHNERTTRKKEMKLDDISSLMCLYIECIPEREHGEW